MKKQFNFWWRKKSKAKGTISDREELSDKEMGEFEKKELSISEENRWKSEIFDTTMNPREWMARFGHNILVGDFRIYKYRDKEFEKWIHQAFEALSNEGLETLWKEYLTDEEIIKARGLYEKW